MISAALVATALVAGALPGGGARAAAAERPSAPEGTEIEDLGDPISHGIAPGDRHHRIDDLKRFNHTVVHGPDGEILGPDGEILGPDGEILRVIVLGPKKPPPPVPRAKPLRAAFALDAKLPDRGPAPLRPSMRALGWPVAVTAIGSGFGLREHPVLGGPRPHRGVDLPAPSGTPVRAAADGTIRFHGRNGSYGRFIRLDHGFGLETRLRPPEGLRQGSAPRHPGAPGRGHRLRGLERAVERAAPALRGAQERPGGRSPALPAGRPALGAGQVTPTLDISGAP